MDELQFSEVVNVICKHPHAYTQNGTFVEVSIFLEEYALGAKVGGLKHRNSHSKFSPFFRWLVTQKGFKNIDGPWEHFRRCYSDDTATLEGLAKLYREYAESERDPYSQDKIKISPSDS